MGDDNDLGEHIDLDLSHIVSLKPRKTIWVNYDEDFDIEVAYLPKEELVKMVEQATTRAWNRSTHQREEKIDNNRLTRMFTDAVVKNWRGLTIKLLKRIAPVKEDVSLNNNLTVPYTQNNAEWLVKASYDLDPWLRDKSSDLSLYQEETEVESLKNF